jgi:hypothetical protein
MQSSPFSSESQVTEEENRVLSTYSRKEEQDDQREPLKELSDNDKENQENPEQEQEEDNEEGGENSDKINDYVAKVLDKLVKQRKKMAKLSSILDKKGLLAEKNVDQVQNMSQPTEETTANESTKEVVDEEDDTDEVYSKENLSPLRNKYSLKVQNGSKGESPLSQKSLAKYSIDDLLQVSQRELPYGSCFPGQIIEEHLDIVNRSGHDFVVQIIVTCLNDDLQNTEEYVYSVRRSHLYDYNDKHYLIMAPYSCADFKFALKAPNLRMNGKIMGQAEISIQGLDGSIIVDLIAKVSIPKVFCPKELAFQGLDYKVIKVAVKEGKKQELKIPIRNSGDVPVTLELEFYDPNENKEEVETSMLDCMIHPNVITIAPNSNALTALIVKPSKSLSLRKGNDKPKPERKILVGRVRDSALIYSFVFWVETY